MSGPETAQIQWEPGHLFRAVASDGTLWAESSNRREVENAMRPGDKLYQLLVPRVHPANSWVRVQPDRGGEW